MSEELPAVVNNDPDGLTCYEDHAYDIGRTGVCSWCGSREVGVIGHVLPDTERLTGMDPVQAAKAVVHAKAFKIVDGVLLDHFTASAIVAVHDALTTDEAKAKLRAMPLVKAATVCLKLIK